MRFPQQEYQKGAESQQTENAIFCRDAENTCNSRVMSLTSFQQIRGFG
jgi:hypothetical protein